MNETEAGSQSVFPPMRCPDRRSTWASSEDLYEAVVQDESVCAYAFMCEAFVCVLGLEVSVDE